MSFEQAGDGFSASVSMNALGDVDGDLEALLARAARCYCEYVSALRRMVAEMETRRKNRSGLTASMMWAFGDAVFQLVDQMESMNLQIDGLYDHLARDLSVKRKWLEKAIIFRRYVPRGELIPPSLLWGRCEKGTRKVARKLLSGEMPM